ncbi:MAG: hypothetical protein Q8L86_11090 [Vicinamibacterales bacterium]|nr:hypothetical protein [Vicinamibacterales bacterium]
MKQFPRIGAAAPAISERAALIDALEAAGCEPVPMFDLASLPAALHAAPMEALIADAALVSDAGLPVLLRTLGPNRPLILLGERRVLPDALRRHVGWLARPFTPEALALAVALALGEGRPARRSPRRHIRPIAAAVDGVASRVLDVSIDGVRFEVSGIQPGTLPPQLTLRVVEFGVASTVRRAWVRPVDRTVVCGGRIVDASARAAGAWRQLVETTPGATTRALWVEGRDFK